MGLAAMATIKPFLTVGSYAPKLPWPWGVLDFAARVLKPAPGTVRATIALPHCTAQLVRAAGVLPADGKRTVILYLHGGAFLTCGVNTHGRLVTALSKCADAPALVVNYRMIPKHSVGTALDDCYDAYTWLRETGYEPDQIVLAGDSAGGYLALALAERLQVDGINGFVPETPAAIVDHVPAVRDRQRGAGRPPEHSHRCDVPAQGFPRPRGADRRCRSPQGRRRSARRGLRAARPHRTRSAADAHPRVRVPKFCSAMRERPHVCSPHAGVPVEIRIWPGQMHVFQLGAPAVSEASRSIKQIGEYIREATW